MTPHFSILNNSVFFCVINSSIHNFFGAIGLYECAKILGFMYEVFMYCGAMQICTYGSVLEDDIPFSLVYSHLLHSYCMSLSLSPTTVCVLTGSWIA